MLASNCRPRLASFALLAASIFAGCGGDESAGLADRALRARFPAEAHRILDAGDALTLVSDGFGPASPLPVAGRHGLGLTLPSRGGDAAVRFTLPSGFHVDVREHGLAGEGAPAGHAIAYPRKGGTSYWAATPEGYEEWLLLEAGATSPDRPAATWEIAGGTLHQAGEAVEIADEAGVTRMVVRAPSAFDAAGRPVPVRLSAVGSTLELSVDAAGEAVLVDPAWTATASMISLHGGGGSVVLPDGRMLVAGGWTDSFLTPAAEVYDPSLGAWSLVGSMMDARGGPVTALLPNGKVLFAAGLQSGNCIATAELFDPATNSFSPTGSMAIGRCTAGAALLGDGRLLVAGGEDSNAATLSSAEVYDPATGHWSTVAPLAEGRQFAVLAPLQDGRVLAAGGGPFLAMLASAEIYDATANTWTPAASMKYARGQHTLTALPNGQILAVGGSPDNTNPTATAELYDPSQDTWSAAGTLSIARAAHTATLLPSGKVLVAGGGGATMVYANVDIFDLATNQWTPTAGLATARTGHVAGLLHVGKVLVAGGWNGPNDYASSELFGGDLVLGAPCAWGIDCKSGFCADGVCCDRACDSGLCDACSVATGALADGTCTPLNEAATCNDDNACTLGDTCQNGACVGSPVTCTAIDECHQAGTCQPATAACDTPAKPDGTPCSIGACVGGSCMPVASSSSSSSSASTTSASSTSASSSTSSSSSSSSNGGGGAGGDTTGSGGSGGAPSTSSSGETTPAKSGCGCEAPGGDGERRAGWLAALAIGMVAARRRRRETF